MVGCLQWATAAVAALALGMPPPPTQCTSPPEVAVVRHAVGWDRAPGAGAVGRERLGIAHHVAGVRALAGGDARAAQHSFTAATKADPTLAIAFVGRIVASGRAGDPDGARAALPALEGLLDGSPHPEDLRVFAVDEQLVAILEPLIRKQAPGCAACWRHLGGALAVAAKRRPDDRARPLWRRAAGALRRALEVSPADAVLRMELARVLGRCGWLQSAVEVLAEGVRLEPAWRDGRKMLGRHLLALHRPDEAIEQFKAANDLPALAAAYRSAGRPARAADTYARIGRSQARGADVLVGWYLANKQADRKADIELLVRATQLRPADPAAWYALAQACQETGDDEGYRVAIRTWTALHGRHQARLAKEETAIARRMGPQDQEGLYQLCIDANR